MIPEGTGLFLNTMQTTDEWHVDGLYVACVRLKVGMIGSCAVSVMGVEAASPEHFIAKRA